MGDSGLVTQDLEERIDALMTRHHVPATSVHVRRAGEVLLSAGFGQAAEGRAATADTVFGVASITKSLSCLAVMQLADNGRLRTNQRVADLFSTFNRPGWDGIELHHLMSNSSGLPPMGFRRNGLARAIEADPSRELLGLRMEDHLPPLDSVAELAGAIGDADVRLLGPPGSIFSYSNEGFSLLGGVIEQASGTDYVTYVTRHILEPLGMTRSVFTLEDLAALDDVADLYSYVGGYSRVRNTPGYYWAPALLASGYLRSSAPDLARYVDVFSDAAANRIVSPGALEAMMTPHVQLTADTWYGYGLKVSPDHHGVRIIHHGGSTKGVGATLSFAPDLRHSSIVLTNISDCPVQEMAFEGLHAALGMPPGTPTETFAEGVPDAGYAGTYRSAEHVTLVVQVDGAGQIRVRSGALTTVARPLADSSISFAANGSQVHVKFLDRDEAGFRTLRYGMRVLHRSDLPLPVSR